MTAENSTRSADELGLPINIRARRSLALQRNRSSASSLHEANEAGRMPRQLQNPGRLL
jgi:hypothetical protein